MSGERPNLLTVTETAVYCCVSTQTIRRWIRDGRLESVRLPSGRPRIPRQALVLMGVLSA